MATKNTATATNTAAKAAPAPAPAAAAVAPQATAPAPAAAAVAPQATAPAPAAAAVAPQAPLYTCQPYSAATRQGWPAKAQGGNTVRAYCYAVAVALAKAQPQGFTLAQYASALAANAAGSTMRQPGNGWGTAAKPNGVARQHAAWFAAPAQAWLVPVAPAKG